MSKKKETTGNLLNRLPLSSSSLLQLNATIIAGLFILLTFQISELPTQEDAVQQIRKLDIEEILLNQKFENATGNFKNKISDKLDEIKIERESVRAELTAVTKIPYVIYLKSNPMVFAGIIVIPFVLSSMIIVSKGGRHQLLENFPPKYATLLTLGGLGLIMMYFIYHIFPYGRFITDQFIYP